MTFEEFIKKLEVALADKDTAEGLKSFGIEPEQIEGFKDLTIPSNLDEACFNPSFCLEWSGRL